MSNYKDYFEITTTQNESEHSIKEVKLEVQQIKPFDFSPISIDNVDSILESINKQVYEKIGIAEDSMILREALLKAQMYDDISNQLGCPLEVREKALNGFYIPSYGYVSNDDDFIYLRKDDKGYYLKVVIHPSKPTPPHFYGYCDIHYLKDYKKTWWLSETKEE